MGRPDVLLPDILLTLTRPCRHLVKFNVNDYTANG
jgi:hypothetical protein